MLVALTICLALPPTVTFDTKAARLPVILGQLQAHSQAKLECEHSFANDVLVIRAKDVEFNTLLERIAFATVGSWRKERDKLVLTPDLARRKQQESELAARREKQIQFMLDKLAKELEPAYDREHLNAAIQTLSIPQTSSNGYYERIANERQGPLQRLAMRALISMGVKRLAAIKPGERLVFSSSPTPRQLPWPGLSNLLPKFFQEWNLYQELKPSWPDGRSLEGWSSVRGDGRVPTILDSVDLIWMSVSDILKVGDIYSVSVGVANKEGTVAFGANPNLQMDRAPADPIVYSDAPNVPLTLDADSIELGRALATTISFPREPQSVDPPLVRTLKTPLVVDPLSFGSEVYSQYADARKVNLVAWINDNAFQRFIVGAPKSVLLRDFEARSRPNMIFTESPGWLVLAPSSPVEARRSRDDRQVIDRLVKSIDSDKRLTLEARANYVLRRPYGLPEGLGRHLALMLDQEAAYDSFTTGEDVLRLYGALTPAQRTGLMRGDALIYGSMDAIQKTTVDRLIYGPKTLFNQVVGIFNRDHQLPPEMESYRRPAIDAEPTFAVPNGVSFVSPLSIVKSSGFQLEAKSTNGMTIFSGYDISQLASQIFYEANPELVEGDLSAWRRPDLFVAFDRQTFKLRMDLTDGLYWSGSLIDARPLTGRVKKEDLPQAVKDAVAKEVDRLNKMKASGVKMSMRVGFVSGQQKPPPP